MKRFHALYLTIICVALIWPHPIGFLPRIVELLRSFIGIPHVRLLNRQSELLRAIDASFARLPLFRLNLPLAKTRLPSSCGFKPQLGCQLLLFFLWGGGCAVGTNRFRAHGQSKRNEEPPISSQPKRLGSPLTEGSDQTEAAIESSALKKPSPGQAQPESEILSCTKHIQLLTFGLLVSPSWFICHGPKSLTLYFQVLWASETRIVPKGPARSKQHPAPKVIPQVNIA